MTDQHQVQTVSEAREPGSALLRESDNKPVWESDNNILSHMESDVAANYKY